MKVRSGHNFSTARFVRDRRGGVLIIGALALPVLIGVGALVAEYGGALLTRAQNQRIADQASYAGALAYSHSSSAEAMNAAARTVASLNGVSESQIAVELVPSPRNVEVQAVRVRIETDKELILSRVIGTQTAVQVSNLAFAEVGTLEEEEASACVLALKNSGSGVTVTGGARLTAADCAVASNARVHVDHCNNVITTTQLSYDGSLPSFNYTCHWLQNGKGGTPPKIKEKTPDPFADHEGITAAWARLTTVRAMTAPSAPVIAGANPAKDLNFASWQENSAKIVLQGQGCTYKLNGNTWDVTCAGSNAVTFRSISLAGSQTVNFNLGGSSSKVINVVNDIANGGQALNFGDGTYNVGGGISASGRMSFGKGIFRIGRSAGCGYSICAAGGATLTIDGPSTFELSSGIHVAGGAVVTLGDGATNVYNVGKASGGRAIHVSGGAKLILRDALNGAQESFDIGPPAGSPVTRYAILGDVITEGGSCVAFGRSRYHDIAGGIDINGAANLSSGLYTVDGFLTLSSGGGSNCDGLSSGFRALDATFVLSGKSTSRTWDCTTSAFCASGGQSNLTIQAPTTGPLAKIGVIGPLDARNANGASFSAGASGSRVSGLFYFPNGPIKTSGGASAGGGTGCLQLVGSEISLSGGTTIASECTGIIQGGQGSREVAAS